MIGRAELLAETDATLARLRARRDGLETKWRETCYGLPAPTSHEVIDAAFELIVKLRAALAASAEENA